VWNANDPHQILLLGGSGVVKPGEVSSGDATMAYESVCLDESDPEKMSRKRTQRPIGDIYSEESEEETSADNEQQGITGLLALVSACSNSALLPREDLGPVKEPEEEDDEEEPPPSAEYDEDYEYERPVGRKKPRAGPKRDGKPSARRQAFARTTASPVKSVNGVGSTGVLTEGRRAKLPLRSSDKWRDGDKICMKCSSFFPAGAPGTCNNHSLPPNKAPQLHSLCRVFNRSFAKASKKRGGDHGEPVLK